MKRGLLWAAENKRIARKKGLKAEDWKNPSLNVLKP